MGFDTAWMRDPFGGRVPSVQPLMGVRHRKRTRRLRIGTAVTLLPLHHPLACAEQAATADLLSGGRLEFGVGRGSIPSQFHGFRVPVAENRARFDECLEIIRLAWTQERFSYHGTFYDVENLSVTPRPLQRPHPPIRVAVHTPESFAHIADKGLPIYSGTTTTPLPLLRECMATISARLAAGGPRGGRTDGADAALHVGATGAAAREGDAARRAPVLRESRDHLLEPPDFLRRSPAAAQIIRETLANLPFEKFAAIRRCSATPPRWSRAKAVREEFGLSEISAGSIRVAMLPRDEVERSSAASPSR